MFFKGSEKDNIMKRILSFFIFVILIFSSLYPLSSQDSILYNLEDGYIIKDLSFDTSIGSYYLAGDINGSNNSFVIKSKNGQILREEIIENFKFYRILADRFSNTYILGTSGDGNHSLIKFTSSLNKRWETKIKFSDKDILSSFTINDDQEVTILGYSTNKRESDTFVIKIDRNGKVICEKVLDIGAFERPYGIIEDSASNFYVVGESKNKNYDVFVCKITHDFEILWIDYFDNENWEDGGLALELIDNEVIATGYSGKEGWYVFDTVFIKYSQEGNVSSFARKSFSGGSDWVRQFERNGDYYYIILWDILTGKEYTLKLDYYFDILTKNEIQKEETPIKIINIVDKTYFVFTKGNTIYIRDLG
ncbi:MAG: hypothetical protein AMQ22_01468 [Candidatus Methanofastidiosum methylothiophilum]|uniref:Uncharacterized protein n=1 Tax=Candidatus Methanofastidiosum methylothiophilum TaxID=1705564 RepID=A0A150IZH0_9EURY|nr:MAG: hypothetical protein AMQ22_01468 [Candidatus Methanofastidiosum methylthiophilus]